MEIPSDSPPPSSHLKWSGHTDCGRFRKNNEDSFLALTFDAREVRFLGKTGSAVMEGADFLFAVSDGMGGAKSGEFASKIAVNQVTKLLPRSFQSKASGLQAGFNDILTELFDRIHKEMSYLGRCYDECAGMGATLSLCWVTPGWIYFGHIGDSRIYYFPAQGGFRQLTEDHSHVGWLRRTGQINEREARTHPRKNVIAKALGAGHQFTDPQVGAVGYEPGDRFLICSDGIIDGLWDRAIDELIHRDNDPDPEPARRLVNAAVRESGRDNTTAVVITMGQE